MTEQEIRLKLFDWLNEKSLFNGGVFLRTELESGFKINGKLITLVGPGSLRGQVSIVKIAN